LELDEEFHFELIPMSVRAGLFFISKTSTMKIFSILLLLAYANNIFAQQIDSNFAGQNAWLHPTRCNAYGSLGGHWNDVQNSGTKFLRIGGIAYDKCLKYAADYDTFNIPALISMGFVPVVQLSYYDTASTPQPKVWTNPAAAAHHLLINVVKPLYNQGVRNFSIGNEPNTEPAYAAMNINGNNQNTAAGIYDYISAISDTITSDNTMESIFLWGPELSFYNENLVTNLTSGNNNILKYIDKFTYHYYPFSNEQEEASTDLGIYEIDATRENVINLLRFDAYPAHFGNGAEVTSFEKRLDSLDKIIAAYNDTNSTSKKIAITEANICSMHDVNNTNPVDGTDTLITGNSAKGYIAGQFWAEMMAVAMSKNVSAITFWSVIEGSSSDGYATDIGYISSTTRNFNSTYYHYQWMARYFKGLFAWGNMKSNNENQIKVFASKNTDTIAVIIMNQATAGKKIVKLRFDNKKITGTGVKTNINFQIHNYYETTIKNQESLLILFDGLGNFLTKYRYNIDDNRRNRSPKKVLNQTPPTIEVNSRIALENAASKDITNLAGLEQNIPNPFTYTTMINYTLPQKFTTAQIVIAAGDGKIIKEVSVSGSGKGALNVDAAMLSSGVYKYLLIIDGKKISSKGMVLIK